MSTEVETGKRSSIEIKGNFEAALEIGVYTDPLMPEPPQVVLTMRHWSPFMSADVHLSPKDARELAAMLIEHAERVTR